MIFIWKIIIINTAEKIFKTDDLFKILTKIPLSFDFNVSNIKFTYASKCQILIFRSHLCWFKLAFFLSIGHKKELVIYVLFKNYTSCGLKVRRNLPEIIFLLGEHILFILWKSCEEHVPLIFPQTQILLDLSQSEGQSDMFFVLAFKIKYLPQTALRFLQNKDTLPTL